MRKRSAVSITIGIFSLFLVLNLASEGSCQDFPKKPIRLVIAYSAGGGTDVLARAFQKPFEEALGTKILIENIPAGSTKVGTMEVMKAKPDGYTILLNPDLGWVLYYYAKTYDMKVWERLTAIGNLTTEPSGFVEVRADSPFRTWADLVRIAKDNPGKLSCGGGAAGGTQEFLLHEISRATGIVAKYVPFAGGGPSKIALLGGHIDFRLCQPPEAIAMIRAGKTRGLAVSTERRMKALPDVPTFKELGMGETMIMTRSFWGPPKMPQNIVDILARAIEKATRDSAFVKLIEDEFLFSVEFRTGRRMMEEITHFDKKYGPRLAEINK